MRQINELDISDAVACREENVNWDYAVHLSRPEPEIQAQSGSGLEVLLNVKGRAVEHDYTSRDFEYAD